jgi:hypothetical protein
MVAPTFSTPQGPAAPDLVGVLDVAVKRFAEGPPRPLVARPDRKVREKKRVLAEEVTKSL